MAEEKIYPYAVARIRVLEKKLLSKTTYDAMADAKTADDAFRMMIEAGYGEQSNAISARDFETLLAKSLAEAYQTVRGLVPEENFTDVFLIKNDYHNAKVLLKQAYSAVDGEKYLIDGGTIPLDQIKKAIGEQDYQQLPAPMEQAIKKANEYFQKTQNGQWIDLQLDRAVFSHMHTIAKESGNPFLQKYVERICDATNLKSFLRMKAMGKDFEAFTGVYVPGGQIDESTLKAAFTVENPASVFKATAFGDVCEAGMKEGFTVFEKLCDNSMMDFVKQARFEALTLEPLIAYLYAKETESKILRIIMTSKLNQIEPQIIKERIRDAYV